MYLEKISFDFWWDVVSQCSFSTFFHTPYWHQLATKAFANYQDVSIGGELKDGTQFVIPILEDTKTKLGFRQLSSTFAGCYGDLIATNPISQVDSLQIYDLLSDFKTGKLKIIDCPFTQSSPKPKTFSSRSDFTQWIDLQIGYDGVWANYEYSCQKQIKKGSKQGFLIRPATSETDISDYYLIYRDNLAFWGEDNVGYPVSLFQEILREDFVNNGHAILWLIEIPGEKIIGGNLVFYWKTHAVEWHSVFNREYFKYGVRNYLVDFIIKDACERGMQIYDFNPSGGYEGVVQFKRTFGAQQLPLIRWEYQNKLLSVAKNIRKTIRSTFPQ